MITIAVQNSSKAGGRIMDSLKTCFFGGYDKLDSLKYIDTITSEIYMLESAKGSALGGFAKPDVDSYICALLGKAAELREKLCS